MSSKDDQTKIRIPNKVQWALLDICESADAANRNWSEAMKRAEKHMDTIMMLNLARLRDALAEIERLASDALDGKYRER